MYFLQGHKPKEIGKTNGLTSKYKKQICAHVSKEILFMF